MNGWYFDIIIEGVSIQCLDCPECEDIPSVVNWTVFNKDGQPILNGVQPCGEDLDINLNIQTPFGTYINWPEPSQRISYELYDEGWMLANTTYFEQSNPLNPAVISELADPSVEQYYWYRLKTPVSFNGVLNDLRFVSIRGNQDFTDSGQNEDKLLFDKLTGSVIPRKELNFSIIGVRNFTDNLNFSQTLEINCGGYLFNDFYISSDIENLNIFHGLDTDVNNNFINFDPISNVNLFEVIQNVNSFTRITINDTITFAKVIDTIRNRFGLRGKTSGARTTFISRQHFRTLLNI
jgi:hypothetical protein